MANDPLEGVAADGTIRTGARRDAVPGAFEPVLDAAAAAVGDDVALYVYGSVATGQATVGASDVDLLTVGLPASEAARLGVQLSARFPELCRAVEVAAVAWPELVATGDEAHGLRVFLRHYCVPVAGPDPAARLPSFRADADSARGFNGDVAQRLAAWRSSLAAGALPADVARRAARKTLLAVAGLVSVCDETWTTARVPAARRWGELRPDAATDMEQLVGAMESQSSSPEAATALLDRPVARVVAAFAEEVGLWASEPGHGGRG